MEAFKGSTATPDNNWWQNLNAIDRFALMKKYSVKSVTSKAIYRMWKSETAIKKPTEQ